MWSFIDESDRKLKRPIKDLDDIRVAMAALAELRDREIAIDASISPVEVCCAEHVADLTLCSSYSISLVCTCLFLIYDTH